MLGTQLASTQSPPCLRGSVRMRQILGLLLSLAQLVVRAPYRCVTPSCEERSQTAAQKGSTAGLGCSTETELMSRVAHPLNEGVGHNRLLLSLRDAIRRHANARPGEQLIYCETGFNIGHSALTVLQSSLDVQVHTWDYGLPPARVNAICLNATHGGRLHATWGDSRDTLPTAPSSLQCDVQLIDGGHDDDVPASDFAEFRRLASSGTTLIVDDVGCSGEWCNAPQRAWQDAVATQWVEETSRHMEPNAFGTPNIFGHVVGMWR